MIYYSTITNTSRVVEVRQFGNHFRVAVFHAQWSDVELWQEHSEEAAKARFDKLVAMNTRKLHTPQRVAFTAPYVDEATEPDGMTAVEETLSPEAEAVVFPSTLTTTEARAIVRHKGYGGNVADSLYRMALRTLNADKPVVTYAPVKWDEDDGSDAAFESDEVERGNNLLRAVERDSEFRNGGL